MRASEGPPPVLKKDCIRQCTFLGKKSETQKKNIRARLSIKKNKMFPYVWLYGINAFMEAWRWGWWLLVSIYCIWSPTYAKCFFMLHMGFLPLLLWFVLCLLVIKAELGHSFDPNKLTKEGSQPLMERSRLVQEALVVILIRGKEKWPWSKIQFRKRSNFPLALRLVRGNKSCLLHRYWKKLMISFFAQITLKIFKEEKARKKKHKKRKAILKAPERI